VIGRLAAFIVGAAARYAAVTLVLALAITVTLALVVVPRLGVDTSTETMIESEVPFRRDEIAYARAFPGLQDVLVVVVEASDAAGAERAAAALAHRMAARGDALSAVRRPDAPALEPGSGLLYLPTERVAGLTERLIAAQPMLAALAADPSLRGLLGTIDVTMEGVRRGEVSPDLVDSSFDRIAAAIESVLAGQPEPMDWGALLLGDLAPRDPRGNRRVILAQAVPTPRSLTPAAEALAAVRAAAADPEIAGIPGVRVRLTGTAALDAEELASVATGAAWGLVASFVLVAGLLVLALGSWRLVVAALVTLVIGLVWTTAFAASAVGTLNLISVAFGIMFVGIAVDFSLQFAVRYRSERGGGALPRLRAAGATAGTGMMVAAASTAAGFLAFLPTDFRGVAELGLISGVGMMIALVLNLTVLPALIRVLGAPSVGPDRHNHGLAPLDAALVIHHRGVLAVAAAAIVAGLALIPFLRFDVDPLNLKDPTSESVATLRDLIADPLIQPYTLNVMAGSDEEAEALAERLMALPEVGAVLSLARFLPEDQDAKLALLSDAAFVLGPSLASPDVAPPPTKEDVVAAMRASALGLVGAEPPGESVEMRRLANALDAAADRGPRLVPPLAASLIGAVPALLENLRAALAARPIDEASLPLDIVADWLAPDGSVRLAIAPAIPNPDNTDLIRFVAAVHAVAPHATGMAAAVVASGRVVVEAFLIASALALGAILVILALVLRRALDVALVMAPLVLAASITFGASVALGLPINFANIIGLPLLLGIGVSFPIYLVIGWRRGDEGVVQTPTARAVLFSALTTAAAFGTLALSPHPGTAAMGTLLLIALVSLIACNLIALPALLAACRR
jgi:hypothetical protein